MFESDTWRQLLTSFAEYQWDPLTADRTEELRKWIRDIIPDIYGMNFHYFWNTYLPQKDQSKNKIIDIAILLHKTIYLFTLYDKSKELSIFRLQNLDGIQQVHQDGVVTATFYFKTTPNTFYLSDRDDKEFFDELPRFIRYVLREWGP